MPDGVSPHPHGSPPQEAAEAGLGRRADPKGINFSFRFLPPPFVLVFSCSDLVDPSEFARIYGLDQVCFVFFCFVNYYS